MEVLAVSSRDRERLLHKPIRFVAITIRSTVGISVIALYAVSIGVLVESTAAAFALHLTIGKETAGDSAGTP